MAWYNDIIDTGFRILTQSPAQVIAPIIHQNVIRPANQIIQQNVVRPAHLFFSTNPVTRPIYTAGQYTGNVIRAGRLPTPQQYLNAGATIYRQTPLRPVVDAGARFGQAVRTQGIFNAGSRVIQRTPLAAVNTAGRYAGDVIRSRTLPTPQQYVNAGATIYRQTPLRPVVDAGARFGQAVRTQGVFNAGSRVIQRTPFAAVNTAGQYAGDVLRSRALPNRQQVMDAGATIFRQTPLAPAVNAGQRFQRSGGVPGVVAAGNRVFQQSPLAAVNTAGMFAGNVIRAQRLPTPQQYLNAGATIFRQTPLAGAVDAGQRFQAWGGLNRMNPIPSARGAEIQPIGSGSVISPDGRSGSWWSAYSWQNPEQRTAWSKSGSWQQPIAGAADAGGNWWNNRVMSGLNTGQLGGFNFFGGIGALERGELPAARQFDTTTQNFWQKNPVARGMWTIAMGRDPVGYDTTANLGRTARAVNQDFFGSLAGGVFLGIAGAARLGGDAVGKALKGDPAGAAGTVGEAGANAVIGTAQWGVGIPGRVVADPGHAPFQILGEALAGEFLMGGAARGIRGAKGATVQTIGRPLGLFNPDVLVTPGKKFGVPQDAPVRQVESILSNPYSFNVIHTSRQPLSLNPLRGKIFAEPGEGAIMG